ncbi:MAG TPA: acyl carrier protein [Symbiobacteriaceae bacterium]
MKAKIAEFLGRYLGNYELGDDEDIFATGYANSMLAMELVTFMESEFGIRIANEDLRLENFRTLNAMAELVADKVGVKQ